MFADHPIALPAWVDPYLNALEETGLEHTAAAMARTTVRAVRKLASDSAEFAYALEEALERATDKLEAEARRRAVEGIEKGIYFEGERVATERVYSDSLMALFLKGKRRRQFGDKTEVSGPGGAPLTISIRKFSQDPEPIDVTPLLAPTLLTALDLAPARPADITPHALSTVTADDLL